jgi:hypothetical protein
VKVQKAVANASPFAVQKLLNTGVLLASMWAMKHFSKLDANFEIRGFRFDRTSYSSIPVLHVFLHNRGVSISKFPPNFGRLLIDPHWTQVLASTGAVETNFDFKVRMPNAMGECVDSSVGFLQNIPTTKCVFNNVFLVRIYIFRPDLTSGQTEFKIQVED